MIIVFGSLNIDLVMPVDHFPRPGETVLCPTDYLSRPGGKGANQALAASRAGGRVTMVGKVGDDSFGRRSVNNLKSSGIYTSGIGISERPTGCATIAVDPRGENIAMTAPGANLDVTSDQLPDEAFTPKNLILTQLEAATEETFDVLARARKGGAITILNASPATSAVPEDVLKNVDYLIVNELEAQQLAKGFAIHEAAPEKLCALLAQKTGKAAIVTLQEKGSVAADKTGVYRTGALKIDVVDTTGAGDAFCGIFAAGLLAGRTWLDALHRAAVGGSLSCLGLGAQAGIPSAEDIEERLHELQPPQKIS